MNLRELSGVEAILILISPIAENNCQKIRGAVEIPNDANHFYG